MAKKTSSRKSIGPVLLLINDFGLEHISKQDWKDIGEVARALYDESPANIHQSTVEALFLIMYEKVLMNELMLTSEVLH